MARKIMALVLGLIACVTMWHTLGCTMDTGRLFFYGRADTEWGFGSRESETVPAKDGQLTIESELGEEWVRSQIAASEAETADGTDDTGGGTVEPAPLPEDAKQETDEPPD